METNRINQYSNVCINSYWFFHNNTHMHYYFYHQEKTRIAWLQISSHVFTDFNFFFLILNTYQVNDINVDITSFYTPYGYKQDISGNISWALMLIISCLLEYCIYTLLPWSIICNHTHSLTRIYLQDFKDQKLQRV